MGVSHRPGFGLLGSVPRSLSTQPPFATQALNEDIVRDRDGRNIALQKHYCATEVKIPALSHYDVKP